MVALSTDIGYEVSVSCWMASIYAWKPLESERISAMPIIPMLPANEVRKVRTFLVSRLFIESESAVKNDIEGFFLPFSFAFCSSPLS